MEYRVVNVANVNVEKVKGLSRRSTWSMDDGLLECHTK